MEHTHDPYRMQVLLNEHRGWSAMLWKFSPSLRRLVLRVYRFQEARELYVLCYMCYVSAAKPSRAPLTGRGPSCASRRKQARKEKRVIGFGMRSDSR
jgi:hypothetical protein